MTGTTEVRDRRPDGGNARDQSGAAGKAALSVSGLVKRFGGLVAVDSVSFDIESGSITGLIGPNGAGKSTLFNLITGYLEPDDGEIYFDGDQITNEPAHMISRRGLSRSFQISRELKEMTVYENMMLAPDGQVGERMWHAILPGLRSGVVEQDSEIRARAWDLLEQFELQHLADEYAGNLSGGQRKLLELARILMRDPELLLLDEPFAGVNPTLEEKLLDHIADLNDQGHTFLLVEHDTDIIFNNCERVLVMHEGKVLASGEPSEVKNDEQVLEAYLGGQI